MRLYQLRVNFLENPVVFVQSRGSEGLATWITNVGSPPITTTVTVLLAALTLGNIPATWAWTGFYVLVVVLVPLLYVIWLYQTGEITDLHLRHRDQRFKPLLVTLGTAVTAWLILQAGQAPMLLLVVAAAISLQSALFLAITTYWKISVHTASAAMMAMLAWMLLGYAAIWFVLCVPLIAWSRLRLQRHTIAQTVAGAVLGSVVMAVLVGYYSS
jgi:membrane-associated phospholipid phosphatase